MRHYTSGVNQCSKEALKSKLNSLVKYIIERVNQIQARLLRISTIRLLYNTAQRMGKDEASDRAAGVAYYAILALFPLLLGIIALLGLFLRSPDAQKQVLDVIARVFPASSDVVRRNLEGIISARGVLGIISIIGLLWSGTSIFAAISHAINKACGIEKERPFYLRKLRQLLMALGIGVLLLFSMGTSYVFSVLRGLNLIGADILLNIGSRLLGLLIVFCIFMLMYKYIPNTHVSWRFALPGALLGAVLFEVLRNLFVLYVNHARYELIYGSIGSVIALFVWAYFSALIIILGIEFSSEYHLIRRAIKAGKNRASIGRKID